eukprot:5017379-Amphidinium_carterae.5
MATVLALTVRVQRSAAYAKLLHSKPFHFIATWVVALPFKLRSPPSHRLHSARSRYAMRLCATQIRAYHGMAGASPQLWLELTQMATTRINARRLGINSE